jgi:hypothetical protein
MGRAGSQAIDRKRKNSKMDEEGGVAASLSRICDDLSIRDMEAAE